MQKLLVSSQGVASPKQCKLISDILERLETLKAKRAAYIEVERGGSVIELAQEADTELATVHRAANAYKKDIVYFKKEVFDIFSATYQVT
ncbi:hypothetical protein L4C37_22185 [Vibrio kagoshimensis]|uniref:hypothetical protein n=1 Tax=Vibrio kagoshimensis TaxID=2910244 RepID=UPI003D1F5CF2